MGSGRSRLRSWWPALLAPLAVSLVVLFAGASTRLFPEKAAKDVAPPAAEAVQPEDDAAIRRSALEALAKLALSRSSDTGPDEQEADVADEATAPAKPSGVASGILGGRPQSADQKAARESEEIAGAAYGEIERHIAEQAKRAHVVIAVDTTMQVGRDYAATLIIEGEDGKDIMPLMAQTLEPIAAALDVEIAPDAEAYASSSQFAIASITPARQAIRAQAPTVWQWTLTPRRNGEASLMIMLRQNVTIDGQVFSFPVTQFPQIIHVDLTWWLWLRELTLSFWGAVTALLVTGASGATIYNALRSRDGKGAAKQPEKPRAKRKPAGRAA